MELWVDNALIGDRLMRDALDGWFTESERERNGRILPATDVTEDADAYHFYFEMPGLRNEAIDVRVEDGSLIVEAERKRPEASKELEVHRAERRFGPIRRSFGLPEDADSEDVRAAYRDGVLEVTVGKRPESKPVKVKVEFAN